METPPQIQVIQQQVKTAWAKYWFWVVVVVAALALLSLVVNSVRPHQQATTTYTTAQPLPQAVNLPTQTLPAQKVIVLVKQDAIKALKPPPEITNNPSVQITTTAAIPASTYGGSAIAFLNTSTGASAISYKAKPRPLFGLPSDVTVGVRYGVGTRSPGQEGQIYGKWDFLRVGNAYLGAYGEVSTQPAAKAMIDLSMRW